MNSYYGLASGGLLVIGLIFAGLGWLYIVKKEVRTSPRNLLIGRQAQIVGIGHIAFGLAFGVLSLPFGSGNLPISYLGITFTCAVIIMFVAMVTTRVCVRFFDG
jgi:hypothetical protein